MTAAQGLDDPSRNIPFQRLQHPFDDGLHPVPEEHESSTQSTNGSQFDKSKTRLVNTEDLLELFFPKERIEEAEEVEDFFFSTRARMVRRANRVKGFASPSGPLTRSSLRTG